MTPIERKITDFNCRVVAAHNNSQCPRAYTYHLYSDGTIKFQKGGFTYLNRSEITSECQVDEYHNTVFKFVNSQYSRTYAVLTEEQCMKFRLEMTELVNEMNSTR
jgi:hypothetical protein